jgi:hypothetical protein
MDKLEVKIRNTIDKYGNFDCVDISSVLKLKDTFDELCTNEDYLIEVSQIVKDVTGQPWKYEVTKKTDVRKRMLEVFYQKARDKKSKLTGVSLAIYKTMLYGVNDRMIYWKGVEGISEDSMFDRKTVYKHLKILKTNKLVEYETNGFHIRSENWGKTRQIKLIA